MTRCKRVDLPAIVDPRGALMFAEDERHIPFEIRRIFAIYNVPAAVHRGGHAHRRQHQFLIMMSGGCTVSIDEGSGTRDEPLNHPTRGLHVPPMVWIDLRDFTSDAVCLVLTSAHFDETDYVRDHAEFRRLIDRSETS